ncbi:putative receptor-like protein kinase [Arachis hypogaea]|nr:putative receptor-like protein kinase [Arachis hypogaea]
MISKACSWLVLMMFMVLGRKKSLCFSQETCISRCDKLSNISHPFRLKGDPKNCGISTYELECVKDVAILWLPKEAEYKVKAINYKNYTIRLVDPNIEESLATLTISPSSVSLHIKRQLPLFLAPPPCVFVHHTAARTTFGGKTFDASA